VPLFRGENGEARQGIALMAADFWRDAPNPALVVVPQLGNLFLRELDQSVGRVRAHRVNGIGGALLQPFEAISVIQGIFAGAHGFNYSRKTAFRPYLTLLIWKKHRC
jgi:hypothetical protein